MPLPSPVALSPDVLLTARATIGSLEEPEESFLMLSLPNFSLACRLDTSERGGPIFALELGSPCCGALLDHVPNSAAGSLFCTACLGSTGIDSFLLRPTVSRGSREEWLTAHLARFYDPLAVAVLAPALLDAEGRVREALRQSLRNVTGLSEEDQRRSMGLLLTTLQRLEGELSGRIFS